jgi:2-keto-4-pentenoate hydratase/2-oxohepta-3-ene-1,7-dioic acid hydratase in catechol pathway
MHTVNFQGNPIRPNKIVCVARNYREHAKELHNPVPTEPIFFLKPSSAIADTIHLAGRKIRYEAEISILWKPHGNHGIGFGLDLTDAELQNKLKEKGYPWEASKAFSGSAVFSDFMPQSDFLSLEAQPKPEWMHIQLAINGTTVQEDNATSMVFSMENLMHEAKKIFGLEENDILMTGTPSGTGIVFPGDMLEGRVFYQSRVIASLGISIGQSG